VVFPRSGELCIASGEALRRSPRIVKRQASRATMESKPGKDARQFSLASQADDSMDALPPATSLLEELDRRQDEVLAQLEALEDRLKRLLSEYSGSGTVEPALHPLEMPKAA
jgi:predicted transcriptional regulator